MRQAGQIEAISSAKGTLSNIGQKHRRRKAFLGSESKFVSYVKLLCKQDYVNRLSGRRRIALRGRKRARYGMRSIHRVPYLALTDDHDLYSPESSVFSPPVHFRDFHHGTSTCELQYSDLIKHSTFVGLHKVDNDNPHQSE